MTRHRRSPELRHLQGFSLIELMISLTLGLIIMVAVLSTYISSAAASRMAEAQGRMYEDGQAALTILTQQLRMAGYNPYQTDRLDTNVQNPVYTEPTSYSDVASAVGWTYSGDITPNGLFELSDYSIRGCDGAFSFSSPATSLTGATSLDDLGCATDTGPDSIALSYEADRFNTVPTIGLFPTDCLGYPLGEITASVPNFSGAAVAVAPINVSYFVAINRFYIDTSLGSLSCNGSGSSSQALVENIEDMQITYGVENPVGQTRTVAGYLIATGLLSDSALDISNSTSFTAQERWRKVVTVRVCLVVRSEDPVVSDLASAQYFNCAGELVDSPPDLRLRRTFSSTVMLRNWLEIAIPVEIPQS
jgi:type IV pilus assembly protein PilW